MKYRQVYQGRAGYVDHSSYAVSCANALVSYTPSTSATTDLLCTGIAAGALYQYGVNVNSSIYKNRAVVLGGNVRTWLNGSTSRFASEGWAVSGGVAVWGVLNSYYKDPANASGAAAWATTANTNMPLNAANGSNNDYEYGHDGWYGWGHYAISQTLASGTSFQNYRNVVDAILASDGDNDGGIRQGTTYTNSEDYAWSTNIMQFASNYGLISTQYYTISGTVTYNGSPLAGVTMNGLPGTTVPVTDVNGFYTAQVPSGFYCTVTPAKAGYAFTPATMTYNNVTANQTAQNYTALSLPTSGTVTTNTSSSARTSATFSHTVAAGNNRLLAVSVMLRGNITASSVTYGGTALTKAISRASTSSGTTTEIWYLVNPPVGTANVVVNFSASADPSAIAAVNFTGVNQTSPVGATASNLATSGTGITTNITTLNANSLIFGAATNYGGDTDPFTPGANITELWDNATGSGSSSDNGEWGGYRLASTAGTYTFNTTSSASDDWTIAAVELKAVPVVLPPGKATSPSPSSGTADIGVTTDLSWTAGSGATSHLVYFGTVSPGTYQGEQTGNTFDTGTMANNTTYYWRVDEKNASGTTTGDAWNFTTIVRRTLTSSSTTGGDVTTPGEGAFPYDNSANASIVATADAHYHFVNWTGTAVTAGKVASPTSAGTTVQMDADYTVVANFAIDQQSLTTGTSSGGSVSTPGIGTYWYNYGANADIMASPTTGYYFVNWTGSAVTAGKVASPTSASTAVLMDANYTVQANFGVTQFAITASAGSNGSISPSGTIYKDYGSSQLFTATPAASHDVDTWYLDGSPVQTGGTTYTLGSITATHSVNVTFKIKTFSITGTYGANGSVSPSGTFSKDYGSSQLFTASPATGYEVDKWTLDGADIQTGGNTYTLSTITATHTVHVTFKIMTYVVTGTAGANGTVAPSGDTTKDYGSSQLFTASPATGYEVDKWTLDGADIQTGGNTYTLSTITATHTVHVTFKIMTYTVTASYGTNGTVDPTGAMTKDYGSSQLFTASPATGYEVDKWTLDGADIQTGGNTYNLENITTIHTVTVTFSRIVFSISGYMVEIDGNTPVKDVLMSAGDTNTMTDANGYYELSVEYGWSGVITPEKEGYVFEPNSKTYDNVTQYYSDVNYTAALMTFKIAGYVLDSGNSSPISNASVSAENGGGPWTSKYGGGSSLTDASGYYEVIVDYNWSGKVTPAKYAYAFEPNGTSYENVNADTAGQNYAGTLLTFKISGCIRNECNVPIAGVMVSADNGGGQAMTDANGLYEVWVSYAWSGTVTPEKPHYTFNPAGLIYTGVLADQAGQNYAANNIYDLDCNGYIDLGDVSVICENWLITGSPTPIPGDFDADGTVDFADFAVFVSVWGD
jgi:hypothetical protein